MGMLFTDFWHDKEIHFNGSEWTTMYFWNDIQGIVDQNRSKDGASFDSDLNEVNELIEIKES